MSCFILLIFQGVANNWLTHDVVHILAPQRTNISPGLMFRGVDYTSCSDLEQLTVELDLKFAVSGLP